MFSLIQLHTQIVSVIMSVDILVSEAAGMCNSGSKGVEMLKW